MRSGSWFFLPSAVSVPLLPVVYPVVVTVLLRWFIMITENKQIENMPSLYRYKKNYVVLCFL
jgi:hypothetical protein